MHSGRTASFEWERASLLPASVANLSIPLLLHTALLIRMKLAYNAYPASDSSYQNNKITHKKAHQLRN
jgi:hypothetical protein